MLTEKFEKWKEDQGGWSGVDEVRMGKVGVREGGNDMSMWHLLSLGEKLGFYSEWDGKWLVQVFEQRSYTIWLIF